uniref:Uncharacterized protein n=1 Tax=Siphoviridae sp. ctUWs1 TaxID=2826352 RepID=A0A8S5QTW5_9CAUD|nr:MAG TPA: hypothetical protein [Siphoviridae sp. ctUWs1]
MAKAESTVGQVSQHTSLMEPQQGLKAVIPPLKPARTVAS